MAKYDLSSVVEATRKLYKDANVTLGDGLKTLDESNFMKMPKWWQEGTNTFGIPFGSYVMLAGDSDSGKTSAAVSAMKAAQSQDMAVIYVETEGKTTKEDLANWGVDLKQTMIVAESVAESAFSQLFSLWDEFFKKYKDGRLLVVFDSIGNILSRHDMELDLETSNQKPGGKGKTNRLGVNKLIVKCRRDKVAMLLINYTYDNMGSPGKTNAGGKALNLFSSLTYQTSRKNWIEKTVKGQKVRIGATVQWKLFKNHIDKANPGPKVIEMNITSKGIELGGNTDENN